MIPILTNIFQMGWNHQLENDGNPPFEDVSPIQTGGFSASYVSLPLIYHL